MQTDPETKAGAAAARTAVLIIALFVVIAGILGLAGGHIDLRGVGMQLPAPNAPITIP